MEESLQQNLDRLRTTLEHSEMGEVETHLLVLQEQLKQAPHLVDMLLPEDIGLLVSAERKRCATDMLTASMPKARVKRAPAKAKTKPMTRQEVLKELEGLDDF